MADSGELLQKDGAVGSVDDLKSHVNAKPQSNKKELRGCRVMSDISIENLENKDDSGSFLQSYAQVVDSSSKVSSSSDKSVSLSGAEGGKHGDVAKEMSPALSEGSTSSYEKKNKSALQVPYFSGNHFVEVTKGILHLYKENQRTSLDEEAERSEMLCILAVPGGMTTHDLLQFTAPVSYNIEQMRIIRNSKPNQYMVLIKFKNQKSADEFYENFNGMRFNSIEPEICHLVYVAKVESVKESEESCRPLYGHTELPTCPVCLERMDESVEGILTILCNHAFHGNCLAKWGDTSCPVCRYSQTPELVPDNHCFTCGCCDNLWICLICGNVGCGRYEEGHAFKHYLDTQHTYAMQLGNNRVWDYAGDNYVHRLVQNKADGKPVELMSIQGEIQNEEKLDSIQLEYTYLLTSQLETQRHFFEGEIARVEKETSSQIEELKELTKVALEGRQKLDEDLHKVTREKNSTEKKLHQVTTKLNKALSELKEEKELNDCLRKNQQLWKDKLDETQKQFKDLKEAKEQEISELKEQVRDLMFYLEAQQKIQTIPEAERQDIQEGQIVVDSTPSSSTPSSVRGRQRRRKNR